MTGESTYVVFHDPQPKSLDEGQGHVTLFNFGFIASKKF